MGLTGDDRAGLAAAARGFAGSGSRVPHAATVATMLAARGHRVAVQPGPSSDDPVVVIVERAGAGGRQPCFEMLSARERQVAELVARGRSNRETAVELFVSVGT